jgi:hypothetical protein
LMSLPLNGTSFQSRQSLGRGLDSPPARHYKGLRPALPIPPRETGGMRQNVLPCKRSWALGGNLAIRPEMQAKTILATASNRKRGADYERYN